jgi:hypothetical protein
MIVIPIHRVIAKPILWLLQFIMEKYLLLVCKGYDEDEEYFTGLYWNDDKDMFFTDKTYFNYQLWVSLNPKIQNDF